MEPTRRSILKALGLSVVVASVAPEEYVRHFWALGAPRPRLWCDGIHDDQPALQEIINALVANRAPRVLGDWTRHPDGRFILLGSTHRVDGTVVIPESVSADVNHCKFINFGVKPMFDIKSSGSRFTYNTFTRSNPASALPYIGPAWIVKDK